MSHAIVVRVTYYYVIDMDRSEHSKPHVIKDSAAYKYECSGGAARLWAVSNPFPPSYMI